MAWCAAASVSSSCDVGICTNVAADHLGLKDINTLEDLAHVKSTVPRSVRRDGYAILNADDDLVMAMRKQMRLQDRPVQLRREQPPHPPAL